jgi:uncharacterized protein (UPF0305 family)
MSIAELTDKALALPPKEKAELIDALLSSMEESFQDISREDIDVALQRKREMDEGIVHPLSLKEFFKPFESRYGS